jgi:hypothetical protein
MANSTKILIFLAVVYGIFLLVWSQSGPNNSLTLGVALVPLALTGLVAALLSNADGRLSKLRLWTAEIFSAVVTLVGISALMYGGFILIPLGFLWMFACATESRSRILGDGVTDDWSTAPRHFL